MISFGLLHLTACKYKKTKLNNKISKLFTKKIFYAKMTAIRTARQHVWTGKPYPSRIELPLLP